MRECQHCKTCYADDVETCPTDGMPTMHTISGEPVLEGKYHLESRIGQGGMGVVYKARHAYLKTLHAIKIILPDLVGNDPELVKRFRQEALAAAAIRHQNVVQVTDYGVAQGTMPFLVMEFVEGESLHDLLAREERLSPERAFELTAAICSGIGTAHNQGIVHRDLKPLNIMLLSDKQKLSEAVKILDFGLAKIKSGELLGSFIQAQTTGLMGSPYYMAPEQWSDDDLDARSDIYSIGVMLYQMIAGDVPFKGSSIPAIMKKHLTDTPPPFAERGVQVPPAVEQAVFHTLEKSRANRTASVDDLIDELSSALGISSAGVRSLGHKTGHELPVAPLRVLTNPPKSTVYLNSEEAGQTHQDGWLLLEGIQSGNHHIKVTHEGFVDWEADVFCDGSPVEVVARLDKTAGGQEAIPQPGDETVAFGQSTVNEAVPQSTATPEGVTQQTVQQQINTGDQGGASGTGHTIISTPRSSSLKPLLIGGGAFAVVGFLVVATIIGLYATGFIGGGTGSGTTASPTPTTVDTPSMPAYSKEMVRIDGGEFTMGRNDGAIQERPEHKITVEAFEMDKTEVTNAEYFEFISATNYSPPAHFVNGRPLPGKELTPVNFVSLKDAREFAKWRSERDKVQYRLPTEAEWEYAARNGNEDNLYPWGDEFSDGRAVIGELQGVLDVGSYPSGANKWGVLDLIGNVWEWTSSDARPYPGSDIEVEEGGQIIRGGGFFGKTAGPLAVTSTFRGIVEPTEKNKEIGFRLVK
ncbi:MAG: PEGA domain-containing protein [Acidobacteria bacterium]|nr:MAG: PEGA domain-containing protein [Acidobacteriota bacterium]REK02209.1 MAG: PEGA domain-containing protein [Acidobacteriota bacterium]REK13988.1 MAG: PEGA domain-containing protein [Acidobacteriota bacterium]REK41983.1 MAG: PEGA domain-containing protein [Acidobacteriota bacterium]